MAEVIDERDVVMDKGGTRRGDPWPVYEYLLSRL